MKKQVKVKPNAKQTQVIPQADGSLVVWLKSPPVEGKANQELIAVLAKTFGVPPQAIRILRGQGSRLKLIEIEEL